VTWLGALLVGLGLVLAPGPAAGALVYGRVFHQGTPQPRRDLRVARTNVRFRTDEHGRYSIFLPPGIHCVESDGLRGLIQSHPQPIQQDVVLAPGRC
jgi:hypothetical protein